MAQAVRLVQGDDIPALARYVRTCANGMGLRDWDFEIMHEPPVADQVAEIRVHEARRYARLWFCAGFRRLPPEQQRHAVVHELVHPHLSEMHFVLLALRDDLGMLRFTPIHDNFNRAEEKAVDALASVISPSLPMISWG